VEEVPKRPMQLQVVSENMAATGSVCWCVQREGCPMWPNVIITHDIPFPIWKYSTIRLVQQWNI